MSAQTSHDESDALPTETLDVVVIGGGAAGLNGALMLARSRRSVVVIDSGTPRNAPAAAMHGLIVLDGTPPPEVPGLAGTTETPGVWVAGNATNLAAQVGASAAAGALAGSHINAMLATADTDAALAAVQKTTG